MPFLYLRGFSLFSRTTTRFFSSSTHLEEHLINPKGKFAAPRFVGRVVANYGPDVLVQDIPYLHQQDAELRDTVCSIKGKGLNIKPVAGDYVVWERNMKDDPNSGGVVIQQLPRKNTITRASPRGEARVLATNVDQSFVVVAPEPILSGLILDRFIVGAHLCATSPFIVVNKLDVLQKDEKSFAQVREFLRYYEELGYPLLYCSSVTGEGLDKLSEALKNCSSRFSTPPFVPTLPSTTTEDRPPAADNLGVPPTSILIGQSGVGKSSILNQLIPGLNLKAKELSRKVQRGRHTTSAMRLYHAPNGGQIIDSPGFDNYFPPLLPDVHIRTAFVDFVALASSCKYSSCNHVKERDCAVKAAVESGKIPFSRYESYMRLIAMMHTFDKNKIYRRKHPKFDEVRKRQKQARREIKRELAKQFADMDEV